MEMWESSGFFWGSGAAFVELEASGGLCCVSKSECNSSRLPSFPYLSLWMFLSTSPVLRVWLHLVAVRLLRSLDLLDNPCLGLFLLRWYVRALQAEAQKSLLIKSGPRADSEWKSMEKAGDIALQTYSCSRARRLRQEDPAFEIRLGYACREPQLQRQSKNQVSGH